MSFSLDLLLYPRYLKLPILERIFVSFGGSRDRESSEKFRKEQVGLDGERIEINFQTSLYFYPQKSLFLPVNRCLR